MKEKYQMHSVEVHAMIEELQFLLGGKVEKLWNPHKKEIVLRLYVKGAGKQYLRIYAPYFLYTTKAKQSYEKASSFAMYLRRKLTNARIQAIVQQEFERVVRIDFSTKETMYSLYIELFSTGNILLVENGKILSGVEYQTYSLRSVRPNVQYVYPQREHNVKVIEEDRFVQLMMTSQKSVVKVLASDFGFGGLYAEELCSRAGISKDKKDVSEKESKGLFSVVQTMLCKTPKGFLGEKHILPFKLKTVSEEVKEFETYSAAFVAAYPVVEAEVKEKKSKYELELERIKRVISEQTKQADDCEEKAADAQRKGELIYEHYQLVETLLQELKKASKTLSWSEIKKKLKTHSIGKRVKQINQKEGKITVEL